MASFFASLHLLNLKQYEFPHTVDVNCIKLSEKYNCPHGQYSSAKSEYFLSHCSKCEHQWKVKKNIKYVDKLIKNYKCLFLSWDLNHPLILFFSNGSIVGIEFNSENNTLLKVHVDNNLCGKFLPSRIVDVVICDNCIYVTYTEPKLTLVHINKESPSLFLKIFGRKKGKLVGFEPKIVNFDLFVHSSKSLERKLSLNIQKNLLLVWWKNSSDDVWPWTPVTYLTDRVNMLVYSINGSFVDFLCSVKVQDELLHATFSKQDSKQFFSLEEIKKEEKIIVNVCIREIVQGECQLVHTAELPLHGKVIAFEWSSDDKLLVADSSGFLVIYNNRKKSCIVTNLSNLDVAFPPKYLSWHPQNSFALIICKNNNLMCFDAALHLIGFKLCYKTASDHKFLELGTYFYNQFTVQKVLWQKSHFNDTCLLFLDSEIASFILIKFSFGYITQHNVSALEIISQYLKCDQLAQAILLLDSLCWFFNSNIKFQCLSKIINNLLRQPLNSKTQSFLHLALNTFYGLITVLPKEVVDVYEPKIHHLARRFFHHLLRYYKFREAFLLAVDLESQDLFLDLYHVAKQRDEGILAAVALHKAEECSDSSDSCTDSCASDSSSESSSNSNDGSCESFSQNISSNMCSSDTEELVAIVEDEDTEQFRPNIFRYKYCNYEKMIPQKNSEHSKVQDTISHEIVDVPGPSSLFPHSVHVYKKQPSISDYNSFDNRKDIFAIHNFPELTPSSHTVESDSMQYLMMDDQNEDIKQIRSNIPSYKYCNFEDIFPIKKKELFKFEGANSQETMHVPELSTLFYHSKEKSCVSDYDTFDKRSDICDIQSPPELAQSSHTMESDSTQYLMMDDQDENVKQIRINGPRYKYHDYDKMFPPRKYEHSKLGDPTSDETVPVLQPSALFHHSKIKSCISDYDIFDKKSNICDIQRSPELTQSSHTIESDSTQYLMMDDQDENVKHIRINGPRYKYHDYDKMFPLRKYEHSKLEGPTSDENLPVLQPSALFHHSKIKSCISDYDTFDKKSNICDIRSSPELTQSSHTIESDSTQYLMINDQDEDVNLIRQNVPRYGYSKYEEMFPIKIFEGANSHETVSVPEPSTLFHHAKKKPCISNYNTFYKSNTCDIHSDSEFKNIVEKSIDSEKEEMEGKKMKHTDLGEI